MLKIINYFLFYFFILIAYSQQQQNIWLFGAGSQGIKFDPVTHIPSVIAGKYSPYGNEGCSVATDPSTGNLLFYSDGIKIADANNLIMPNGNGLLGNSSSAQNAWICVVPGNCNQYYVFSNTAERGINPSGSLYYSIVDMTLPGNGTLANPKGDVIPGKKNILVNTMGSEAFTITKSPNYNEYWLLCPVFNTKDLRIYKITVSGIQLLRTYTGALTFINPLNIRYSPVSNKFSITTTSENAPVIIGNFNPINGTVTSLTALPGTPFSNNTVPDYGCYDAEWSSDGTKLYIGKSRWYPAGGGRIYQYDFSNPLANPSLIYDVSGNMLNTLYGLKIGPDNKIYVLYNSPTNGYRYIGRIENPNANAAAVAFNPTAIDMGIGYISSAKFPEFMIFDNHKPIAVDDDLRSSCTSQSIDINVLANDTDSDNNTLTATTIKTYKGSSTHNSNGTIHYVPLAGYIGNDTIWYTACDNACVSLCDTAYVLLCTPRICSNNPPIAVTDIVPCFYNSSTMIIDVLKNDSDPNQDSIYISSVQSTQGTATIYRDTLIQYIPNPAFSGTATITYTVCDTSTCNSNNCSQISFDLCIDPPVCINNHPIPFGDSFACIYDSTSYVILDVLKNDIDPDLDALYIPAASVFAAHGKISVVHDTLLMYSPNPGFTGNDVISYTICDTSPCTHNCVQTSVSVCILTFPIKIPNLFTPNGDNHNETFFIEGLYPNTKVSIYNRWGELVYETNNYDNSWGKNEKVTDGLYYCQLVDPIRAKTYKGWLQVLGRK